MCGFDDPTVLRPVRPDDRGSWGILSRRFFDGRVDPDGVRQIGRLGLSVHKALGMRRIGRREHVRALGAHGGGLAEVDDGRREKAEPTVVMCLVVPREKHLAERATVFEGSEAVGELRTVLQRAEVRF